MKQLKRHHSSFGFTLAELLIALSIWGIISAFTVSKVVSSYQQSADKAKMKENVSVVLNLLYSAINTGVLPIGSHTCGTGSYFNVGLLEPSLNYTKKEVPPVIPWGIEWTLNNGSTLWASTGWYVDFVIDINGPEQGSNTDGEDLLRLSVNDSSSTCQLWMPQGRVVPLTSASLILYEALFKG
jgi:prepilin-type N-terminal cleavage/methylation domain-containing protein